MKNFLKFGAVVAICSLMITGAFAQGKKPMKKTQAKHTMAKTVMCPVCKMPLSTKMTKANPVAVRLKKGGPVMYCCSACKMPASVLVKPKAKAKGHTMMKKSTAKKPMGKKK